MDPQATLYDMLEAMNRNDRQDVCERMSYLLNWIEKGGFMPHVSIGNTDANIISTVRSWPIEDLTTSSG